jgi:hypothetical protein
MIKFEFKWINQEVTPRYRSPAPTAGGRAWASFNADATARAGRPQTLSPVRPATSARAGTIAQRADMLSSPGRAVAPIVGTSLGQVN